MAEIQVLWVHDCKKPQMWAMEEETFLKKGWFTSKTVTHMVKKWRKEKARWTCEECSSIWEYTPYFDRGFWGCTVRPTVWTKEIV